MTPAAVWWLLVVSGAITAAGGLFALVLPLALLRALFREGDPGPNLRFFIRHWGLLIAVIGVLLVYSALVPSVRGPILLGAAAEKLGVLFLVGFGGVKRSPLLIAAAIGDAVFAVLYMTYLGLG